MIVPEENTDPVQNQNSGLEFDWKSLQVRFQERRQYQAYGQSDSRNTDDKTHYFNSTTWWNNKLMRLFADKTTQTEQCCGFAVCTEVEGRRANVGAALRRFDVSNV